MCVLRSKQTGHSNVRAVLRHCVLNKWLHPLRLRLSLRPLEKHMFGRYNIIDN